MKKYWLPVIMLAVFETVAITLGLTMDNLFYLFNFSYIGCSIALAIFLFIRKYQHARRVAQLLVGLYMLVYLGPVCHDNMQLELIGQSCFWAAFSMRMRVCAKHQMKSADPFFLCNRPGCPGIYKIDTIPCIIRLSRKRYLSYNTGKGVKTDAANGNCLVPGDMDKAYHQKKYHVIHSLFGMALGQIPCLLCGLIVMLIG